MATAASELLAVTVDAVTDSLRGHSDPEEKLI